MVSIQIDNPLVEEFYKQECGSDSSKFINAFVEYIENYKIKESFKKGLEEVKLLQNGKIEKRELKHILDEL